MTASGCDSWMLSIRLRAGLASQQELLTQCCTLQHYLSSIRKYSCRHLVSTDLMLDCHRRKMSTDIPNASAFFFLSSKESLESLRLLSLLRVLLACFRNKYSKEVLSFLI